MQGKVRLSKLLAITRITGWTEEESKEFDRLLDLHPDETEEDEEYLSWMEEGAFLQRKITG